MAATNTSTKVPRLTCAAPPCDYARSNSTIDRPWPSSRNPAAAPHQHDRPTGTGDSPYRQVGPLNGRHRPPTVRSRAAKKMVEGDTAREQKKARSDSTGWLGMEGAS